MWLKTFNYCAIIVFFSVIPWAVERWAGYNIRIFTPHSSDFFNSKLNGEHALCVLNHRGDMDWMIGWCLIERAGMLGVRFSDGFKCLL